MAAKRPFSIKTGYFKGHFPIVLAISAKPSKTAKTIKIHEIHGHGVRNPPQRGGFLRGPWLLTHPALASHTSQGTLRVPWLVCPPLRWSLAVLSCMSEERGWPGQLAWPAGLGALAGFVVYV